MKIIEFFKNSTGKTLILLLGLALIFSWFKYNRSESQVLLTDNSAAPSDLVIVPSINLTAPIVYVDSMLEQDIELGLSQGVVHLKGTAKPGEIGNVYIMGHSSNYPGALGKYNSVFRQLPELKLDDEIFIQSVDRPPVVYKIVDIKIVSSNDLGVLSQTSNRKLLTLQTSYPVGTAAMRYLVIAEQK